MRCILGVKKCTPNLYNFEYNPYSFFIGYQITSEYYQTTALLSMGKKIMDLLNNDLKKKNLKVLMKEFSFEEGIHIVCEICEIIQKSICCIFEISDLNSNVMLEIGKSLYKNVIFLRKSKSKIPPADMGGIKYIEYETDDELLSIAPKIADYINRIILKHYNEQILFKQAFFLYDQIKRICKDDEFKEDLNWNEFLDIYDVNKLKEPHDFTLIGIARYKKVKLYSCKSKINSSEIVDIEKYFIRSKGENKLIIENYLYLYLLGLLKIEYNLTNKKEEFNVNLEEIQKEYDEELMCNVVIKELLNDLSYTTLRNFIFIDSSILIDNVINRTITTPFYNLSGIKAYSFLKFIYEKGILKDFSNNILNILINHSYDRYEITAKICGELNYEIMGDIIIKYLEDLANLDSNFPMSDLDLKDKLAYILGKFGNIEAEKVLVPMVDTSKNQIVPAAITALARINSLNSLKFLINLFGNIELDDLLRHRIIDAIKILDKNNLDLLPLSIKKITNYYS